MRIMVLSKPRATKQSLRKNDDGTFTIAVREPAVDDRANTAIRKVLAEYLGIAPSTLRLVRGQKSREKVFEIS